MGFGTGSLRREGQEGDILVDRGPQMPLVQGSSSHAKSFPGEDQGKVAGGEESVAGMTMQALGTYVGDNVFKNWLVSAYSYDVLRGTKQDCRDEAAANVVCERRTALWEPTEALSLALESDRAE